MSAPGWVTDPDRSAALVSYTAVHGRQGPLDQVGPLSVTVELARALAGAILPTPGERFRLTLADDVAAALGVPADERARFTGEVTDVRVVPADGDRTVVQVTGVGRVARLGRVPVMFARPAELDGERVRRTLYQAATVLPLDIGNIDPGTVTVLPRVETGGSNARALVDTVAADSLGQLVEHRSGRLDWHDAEHRRDTTSVVTLDGAAELIRPFEWSSSTATVVNDVEVSYGPADARRLVRVTDTESADTDTGLGPYAVQLDTQLADETAANLLATTVVARYARPAWMLPDVRVDLVRSTGTDEAAAALALSHGDRITVTSLPTDGPNGGGDVFVEGTTESYTRHAWQLALSVADPALAGVGVRWMDLADDLTWDGVPDDVTWLGADQLDGFTQPPPPPPVPTVTVRGTSTWASITGNVVTLSNAALTAPDGTATAAVAGDLAVAVIGSGWASGTPTGWTRYPITGSNMNGAAYFKVLTAADITAGSTNFSLAGSSGGATAVLYVLTGAHAGTMSVAYNVRATSSTAGQVLTSPAITATRGGLLLYSTHVKTATTAATSSRGTLRRDVLPAGATGSTFRGTGYDEPVTADSSAPVSFTMPASGGYYLAALYVPATTA